MKNLMVLAFTSAALVGCGNAPSGTGAPAAAAALSAPDAKATEVLATVGGIIHGGDPAARYQLGEALPLREVSPTALRDCGSCDVEALIAPSADRIYPVLLNGQTVASITLHSVDGVWQLAAIGQGGASGKLADARAQLRQTRHVDGDAVELVRVIGTRERFLAHREQSALLLTSLRGESLAPRPAADALHESATRLQ